MSTQPSKAHVWNFTAGERSADPTNLLVDADDIFDTTIYETAGSMSLIGFIASKKAWLGTHVDRAGNETFGLFLNGASCTLDYGHDDDADRDLAQRMTESENVQVFGYYEGWGSVLQIHSDYLPDLAILGRENNVDWEFFTKE